MKRDEPAHPGQRALDRPGVQREPVAAREGLEHAPRVCLGECAEPVQQQVVDRGAELQPLGHGVEPDGAREQPAQAVGADRGALPGVAQPLEQPAGAAEPPRLLHQPHDEHRQLVQQQQPLVAGLAQGVDQLVTDVGPRLRPQAAERELEAKALELRAFTDQPKQPARQEAPAHARVGLRGLVVEAEDELQLAVRPGGAEVAPPLRPAACRSAASRNMIDVLPTRRGASRSTWLSRSQPLIWASSAARPQKSSPRTGRPTWLRMGPPGRTAAALPPGKFPRLDYNASVVHQICCAGVRLPRSRAAGGGARGDAAKRAPRGRARAAAPGDHQPAQVDHPAPLTPAAAASRPPGPPSRPGHAPPGRAAGPSAPRPARPTRRPWPRRRPPRPSRRG